MGKWTKAWELIGQAGIVPKDVGRASKAEKAAVHGAERTEPNFEHKGAEGIIVPNADVAAESQARAAAERAKDLAKKADQEAAAKIQREKDAAVAARVKQAVEGDATWVNSPTGPIRPDGGQPNKTILRPTPAPAPTPRTLDPHTIDAPELQTGQVLRTRDARHVPTAPVAPATPQRPTRTPEEQALRDQFAARLSAERAAARVPKIPAADLTWQQGMNRGQYVNNGLTALHRQTGKGGDHLILGNMHDDFAKGLRENGLLITERDKALKILSRHEITNPVAVEKHLRSGKPVTEAEYQTMVDFHRRKLEAGPEATTADLLKQTQIQQQQTNGAGLFGRFISGPLQAAWGMLTKNPTPGLQSTPSIKKAPIVVGAVIAYTAVGVTSDWTQNDPTNISYAGQTIDMVSDVISPNGGNGKWADGIGAYRYNLMQQRILDPKRPELAKSFEEGLGRADGALSRLWAERKAQPAAAASAAAATADATLRERTATERQKAYTEDPANKYESAPVDYTPPPELRRN